MEADFDPILKLEEEYGPGYAGNVVQRRVERLSADMASSVHMIAKLTTYLTSTFYTDQQRNVAEAELFRLQTELVELHKELFNTLTIAPDLGRSFISVSI